MNHISHARLLAAAPELLHALKDLVRLYSQPRFSQHSPAAAKAAVKVKRQARVALAHAEGREA